MSTQNCLFPLRAILVLLAASFSLPLTNSAARAGATPLPYTYKSVVIDGGGYVDGIVCHPTAQNVIYARTDVGGAYRWNNATNAWEQMFNWIPNSSGNAMGIESIAIDPSNANRVYAVGGFSGNGTFFASQNQGHTWTPSAPPFACGANNDGRQMGERLMVDPNDSTILYYGTIQNGLYKSADSGKTWSQVASFPVTATSDGCGIPVIQFIKSSGTGGKPTPTIFVGVSQTGSNLYETKNGGATWTAVYSSSTLMPARAAQDGAGNMYLTYNNAAGPGGISAGAVIKLNVSTLTASTVLSTPTGWQYGYGSVSVSAQNASEVVASTIDRWWPNDGLYVSTNGGTTWTDTSTNATVNISLSPYIGTQDPLGSWDGSAQIDPFNSSRVFFGTGGGTTIVTNLTSSSATYTFNSVGIEEMVPLGIGVPATGPLYMVFGDIGGFADTDVTTTPSPSEQFSVGGTTRGLDFAGLAPDDLAILADTAPHEGALSTNRGASWTDFAGAPSTLQGYWGGSIAVSSQGTSLVWTPGGSTQYYSTNGGATWTQSSGGASSASYYECPAVSDRVTDGVFYACDLAAGNFLKSTNGGASFSVVNSGALPTWNSDTPYPVPGISGDIWLPTSVGLYHSTDGGSTWTRINTGYVRCIGFGKAAPGSSYPAIFAYGTLSSAATVAGTYMSTNAGSTWNEIDDVQDQWGGVGIIAGDPNIYGRVYLATGALGVHYGDLAPKMPVNGTYPLTNLNSGMALDNRSSITGGATIVQEPYSGGANRQWLVTNLGSSQVEIVNANSGMALTVSGNSNAGGAAIVQSPWVDSPYQIWTLSLQSNGDYFVTNAGSGLVLDDPNQSKSAGTAQDQKPLTGGSNQQWAFTTILPSTTATVAGTAGNSPWYVSSVTVTLTASPRSLPVASTVYTVDGSAQQTYSAPFAVSGNGIHSVKYWSVDSAGNTESTHTQSISIDATPPATTASVSGATVTLTATDATSGVAATDYKIDGGSTQTYSAPFTVAANGVHTVSDWSVDKAGNTETAHTLSVGAAEYDFETGTQGWVSGGNPLSGIATSPVQHFDGAQSLALNFNGTASGTATITVAAPSTGAGKTVTFHVWIPSGSQISWIQPFEQDHNWAWTGNWQSISGLQTNAWNTITLTVPSTAALPLQQLGIQFGTGAAWTGTCYVDAIAW